MISLIKKDIRMVRGLLILFTVAILLTAPWLLLSKNDIGFYIFFIFENLLITIVICNTETMIENKSKTDIFMTSLPIERKDLVKSKYISFGIYPVIFNLIHYLVIIFAKRYSFLGELGDALGNLQYEINPGIIFISSAICLIYIGIYIPLQYYLEEKSKIIEYILILLLFLIPELLDKLSGNTANISIVEYVFSMGVGLIALIFILIASIIYYISYKISVLVYNKRDF